MNKLIKATLIFLLSTSPLLGTTSWGEVLLKDYWERPLATGSQLFNKTMKAKSGISESTPEKCGICHSGQYKDWSVALHSKSAGPGLTGQLNPVANPEEAISCYFCHAPSKEQHIMSAKHDNEGYTYNQEFNNGIQKSGVSCFVCHMRKGRIYGPPQSEKLKTDKAPKDDFSSEHSFTEKIFFEDALFCAACHQLENGYAINGKILVNTYNEWKESTYGQANIICQNCHMPERRHLFRGIHDPETTRKGLSFNVESVKENRILETRLTIMNSGVGHNFPTYVTPLVVVRGFLEDRNGEEVKGTLKEEFVGRMVTLDLSSEIYDTRIAPGGSFKFTYKTNEKNASGNKMVLEVKVFPDMFYNGLYRSLLRSGNYSDKNSIEKAIKATEESVYVLYRKELEL